jgi:hypothetical protein
MRQRRCGGVHAEGKGRAPCRGAVEHGAASAAAARRRRRAPPHGRGICACARARRGCPRQRGAAGGARAPGARPSTKPQVALTRACALRSPTRRRPRRRPRPRAPRRRPTRRPGRLLFTQRSLLRQSLPLPCCPRTRLRRPPCARVPWTPWTPPTPWPGRITCPAPLLLPCWPSLRSSGAPFARSTPCGPLWK